MVFYFRPCPRRVHKRRRRISRAALELIGALLLIAAAVGLLFLAPKWLLVCLVVMLSLCIIFLVQR